MKFSLPYIDQELSFWDGLAREYKNHIEEIYFPLSNTIISSGRPVQPHIHLYPFLEKADVPKAVLINPIILQKPFEQIEHDVLQELHFLKQYYGITKVTVTDLLLCKSIKTHFNDFHISASTLMQINSSEKIYYIRHYVDCITPDTSVLRNLKKLKEIRDTFHGSLKIIVNEGCLPACPFRIQHFFEMCSNIDYPRSLCRDLLNDFPWLRIKSSWVLPQHLHLYDGLSDIIKLDGRVTLQNPKKFLKVFKAYLERTPLPPNEIGCGPAGMIKDIPISEKFFYTTIACEKKCSHCRICQDYYEKYI